jgi:ribosome recycling factor
MYRYCNKCATFSKFNTLNNTYECKCTLIQVEIPEPPEEDITELIKQLDQDTEDNQEFRDLIKKLFLGEEDD